MRELNVNEIKEVNGGIAQVIAVPIVTIVGGVTANYVYESIGGAEGINNAINSLGETLMDAWDNDPIMSRLFPN